jgi:glucose/arabinose dehydrogenase
MSRSQRTLLIVLVLALLGVLAVSALHSDDDAPTSAGPTSASSTSTDVPRVVSAAQLSDFAAGLGEPVYWIGPRRGARYELTETSAGRVYVRYLRDGAEAGDKRPDFVTVATYPGEDGVAKLRQTAGDRKGALARTADGGLLLTDPSSPDSVYLAYPGTDIQVEVYSPLPSHALRLASRGEVRQVR